MQKLAAATLFALVSLSTSATATELCVVCTGPDAAYRCQVDGGRDGSSSDPRLQLLCISQLANEGKHDSCSVNRNATTPCAGQIKIVTAPGSAITPANPPAAASSDHPAALRPALEDGPAEQAAPAGQTPIPAEATEPKPKAPPKTVEELAGQTVQSSKEGIEKAGEAIGGTAKQTGEQIGNAGSAVGTAAKKTWNCVTSLFNNC